VSVVWYLFIDTKIRYLPTRLNGVNSTKTFIRFGRFCFENMALKDVQYEMTFFKNTKSASALKYLALISECLNTSV